MGEKEIELSTPRMMMRTGSGHGRGSLLVILLVFSLLSQFSWISTETDQGKIELVKLIDHWTARLNQSANEWADRLDAAVSKSQENRENGRSLSNGCQAATRQISGALRRLEIWPLKMLDSSGLFHMPWPGWVDMSVASLGDYGQCMEVSRDFQEEHDPKSLLFIRTDARLTQFCPVVIRVSLPDGIHDQILRYGRPLVDREDTDSLTLPLLGHLTRHMALLASSPPPGGLMTGVCVPRSCGAAELELILNGLFTGHGSQLGTTIHLPPGDPCMFHDKTLPIGREEAVSLIMFVGCIAAVLLGTAVDLWNPIEAADDDNVQKSESTLLQVFRCLSISANTRRLFAIDWNSNRSTRSSSGSSRSTGAIRATTNDSTIQSSPNFSFLHGYRVLTGLLVIMIHILVAIAQIMPYMTARSGQMISDAPRRLVAEQTISQIGMFQLDGLITLSGCIVAYISWPLIGQFAADGVTSGRRLKWYIGWALHRWLRSVPAMLGAAIGVFAVPVLLFAGQWLNPLGLGIGPLTPLITSKSVEVCRRTWWHIFLPWQSAETRIDDSCFPFTWSLVIDFQLYLMAPFVLAVLYRNERAGRVLMGALVVAAMAVSTREMAAAEILQPMNAEWMMSHRNFVQSYGVALMSVWRHVPSYVIGLAVGHALVARPHVHFSSTTRQRVSRLAGALVAALLYSAHFWYDPTDLPGRPLTVLYMVTSPTLWSVATGWLFYCCASGQGGTVATFLGHPIWLPASRLSFAVYIFQFPAIVLTLLSLTASGGGGTLAVQNKVLILAVYLFAVALTHLGAIGLYLFAERPASNLERLFLRSDHIQKTRTSHGQRAGNGTTSEMRSTTAKEEDNDRDRDSHDRDENQNTLSTGSQLIH